MRTLLIAAFAILVASCARTAEPPQAAPAPVLTSAEARDIHSFARPEVARVTHVALDLALDFAARRVAGTATLDVEAQPNAPEILLDTKGLEIEAVTDAAGGRALQWNLGEGNEIMGRPLGVRLDGARRIVVRYRSGPDAAALQWLEPAQTVGGRHPYLFSQGQAILNRTWIPTQDSPGIRQSWEARIVAPEPLKVVMSADLLDRDGERVEGGRAYRFRMEHPVAPYLIAIAAGDLAFRPLGPRSGVWTEPAALDRVATELADTERMIDAAEALYGPYRWGRYDMLVLPPSFPFGGMENPRLTFLTPTIIAGDRSLVGTVAHELAHSWSGNLVTNASWADFWLNEGFTTYFENRIMEAIYGPERARQEVALGWDSLQRQLEELGPNAPATALHLDLAGQDPDAGMNDIAYEKGAAMLRTIEAAVGRPRWDAYLRSWFDRHAFQPATAEMFLADVRRNLFRGDVALERRLMLDQWVYRPGLPANAVRPDAGAFAEVDGSLRAFSGGGAVDRVPYAGWNTAERIRFLNGLPRELSRARLDQLDRAFSLSGSGNSEVLFAWLKLAIANRYDPAVPAAERFLTSMGRRKFVAPLFEALIAEGEWGRPIAQRIYSRARPTYHAVTRGSVDAAMRGAGLTV
ncbi:MAG TPA: M1 family metallopeptidase [Allosphingosinicella sp.]|nr:M1 family metallopeptidase [Allosphingosinicella sp.]